MSATEVKDAPPAKSPAGEAGRVRLRQLGSALADPTRGIYIALVITLVAGWVIVEIDGGTLFNQSSTVSLLQRAAALGIVAVGQTMAILAGSLDLSVAYVISLC